MNISQSLEHTCRSVSRLYGLALLACLLFCASPAGAAACNATPRLRSSFLEGYFPAYWTAGQWRTLYSNQKAACIEHLILQYTAQSDPGNLITYYPPGPAMTQLGFTYGGSSDIIDHALTEADKAQYRTSVVVGLQLNESEWFSSAGDPAWLDNQLAIAQTLAQEIWSKYSSHRSFAGWYLPFEVDNCQLQSAKDVHTFVDHFLGPLTKTLKKFDPSKQIFMSPAFDSLPADGCGTLSDWASEWQMLFQRMKNSPAKNGNLDVIALQDGVGALLNQTSVLASWFGSLKGSIAAAALPHPPVLWANTEVYYDPNVGNPMFMNIALADMQAVQNEVVSYTSFTWAENYNQQFVNDAYQATYSSYVSSGTLDSLPPSRPNSLTAKSGPAGSKRITLAWAAAGDSFGVVAYRICRDGLLLSIQYADGTADPGLSYVDRSLEAGVAHSYRVAAMDAAGNISTWSNAVTATAQ